jgi:glycosyltransferase involved in cell wall biosynthesis
MEFSVLISVYYKEKIENFVAAIDSVINQTRMPNEIVLVKDGPLTIELDNAILNYQNVHPGLFSIIELPENKGLGAALGIGLQKCAYPWVARMDTDDICVYNRFEKQIAFLEKHPGIDILSGYISEFDSKTGLELNIKKIPLKHDDAIHFFRKRSPINHVSVILRKEKVLESGNYKAFYLLEDYYLWARMIQNKSRIAGIPDILVKVRVDQKTMFRRNHWKYFINECKLHKYFFENKQITLFDLIFNISIRFFVRNSPSFISKFIYKSLRHYESKC